MLKRWCEYYEGYAEDCDEVCEEAPTVEILVRPGHTIALCNHHLNLWLKRKGKHVTIRHINSPEEFSCNVPKPKKEEPPQKDGCAHEPLKLWKSKFYKRYNTDNPKPLFVIDCYRDQDLENPVEINVEICRKCGVLYVEGDLP
jgi:hypothetical protein